MYFYRSKFLHLYLLNDNKFALFHSLNQEIIYGGEMLKDIFNSFSKSIHLHDMKKKLKDEYLLNFLIDNKFVIADNEDEEVSDYVKAFQKDSVEDYTLLRILLTDLCNLKCRYCKVEKNIKNSINKATPSNNLSSVIKAFFTKSLISNPKIIHITGGEPLLFWEKVKDIVALSNKYKRNGEKFFIVIGTNSILLDQAKIEFIKDNKIKVIVSLDGKQTHHDMLRVNHLDKGTFEMVNQKIKDLKNEGIEVGLSMVVGKHNYCSLDKIIDFFIKTYKPASLGVNFMKAPTHSEKNFSFMITPSDYVDVIYDMYKKYREKGLFMELPYRKLKPIVEKKFRLFDCGAAAGSTINIDSKGNIGPCKSFLIMEEVCSDNITKKNINEILQTFSSRSPLYIKKCHKCPAIGICGNGCAYSAQVDTGNYLSIDKSACQYSQLFHKAIIIDLYNLLESNIKKSQYYIVSMEDRQKLLGNIKINRLSLSSSIGHET